MKNNKDLENAIEAALKKEVSKYRNYYIADDAYFTSFENSRLLFVKFTYYNYSKNFGIYNFKQAIYLGLKYNRENIINNFLIAFKKFMNEKENDDEY